MPSVMLYQLPDMNDEAPRSPTIASGPSPAERLRDLAERLAPMHVLKRTGHRPFAFNGQILGTVCGVDQILPYWYEINVYRTVLGGYVSDVRLFSKGVDAADLFRVTEHEDVEAFQSYLEVYDPCGDLPPIRYDDKPMSAAAWTLRAIELQAEMQRITDHFRTTAGALLHALPS